MNETIISEKILEKAKSIRLLVCDVDGVLSDGTLYYSADGIETKGFHTHDGLGMRLLQKTGVSIAFITGRSSNMVQQRAEELGIQHVFQGNIHKIPSYESLLKSLNLEDKHVAYMGDDWPDLPLIRRAGLGVAVSNALPQIKEAADYVTTHSGGHGAVREICNLIMQAQNNLQKILDEF